MLANLYATAFFISFGTILPVTVVYGATHGAIACGITVVFAILYIGA
jgi:hypothetical protein